MRREKLIQVRVSEGEYNLIKLYAMREKMTIGNYMRKVGCSPVIVKNDYKVISEHAKEIAEIRNSINRMIFTIDASNNYLPRDIEYIVRMMEEVFELENQLLRTLRKQRVRTDDIVKNYISDL